MKEMELIVSGLAGTICKVVAQPSWDVRDVKAAIEDVAHIRRQQQRLLAGTVELQDRQTLGALVTGSPVYLTVLLRTPEQADWLDLAGRDWTQLLKAPEEAWADLEVVAAAVARCGWALKHAAPDVQSHRDVALAAVRQNGLALQYAAPGLRADSEIVLAAVAQCGRALEFADAKLQEDRHFMLDVVRKNGRALEYASPEFRADREVVLAAVGQCGCALVGAATDLRGDHEVVAAAVSQDRGALIFATGELRADPQFKAFLGSPSAPSTPKPELEEQDPQPIVRRRTSSTCFFGRRESEGNAGLSNLLGKDGALMCEMANLGLPVAPGFCVSSEKQESGSLGDLGGPNAIRGMVKEALAKVEEATGNYFGSSAVPLLLSVREGASAQAEGQHQHLSNIGLTDAIVDSWTSRENPRFIWDSYRRLIFGFASVVKHLDMEPFEQALAAVKQRLNDKCTLGRRHEDCDIPRKDLQELVDMYKGFYKEQTGEEFPQDPNVQLTETLQAILHRRHRILDAEPSGVETTCSTAIVQAVVFGNYDSESAAGVINVQGKDGGVGDLGGEWLVNAQSDDIVAGSRTKLKLTTEESRAWAADRDVSEEERALDFPSLEERMPRAYASLVHCYGIMSSHIAEAPGIEFTVQQGRLWLLQPQLDKQVPAAQPLNLNKPHGPEDLPSLESREDVVIEDTDTIASGSDAKNSQDLVEDVMCKGEPLQTDSSSEVTDVQENMPNEFFERFELHVILGNQETELHRTETAFLNQPISDTQVASMSPDTLSAALNFTGMARSWLLGAWTPAASPQAAPRAGSATRRLPTFSGARRPAAAGIAAGPRRYSAPAAVGVAASNTGSEALPPKRRVSLPWDFEAPSLRLPLWQTAMAGGLAGIATQIAAGNPAACAKALPMGAVCCTCYVNLLSRASSNGDLDSVSAPTRFLCAGVAASVATVVTHTATKARSWVPGRSLRTGLAGAVARTVPAMAIEMCSIDVVKSVLTERGQTASPQVLILAGGAAGFISQTLLYPLSVLASQPSQPSLPGNGGASRLLSSTVWAPPRARALVPLVCGIGPAFRRSMPGAAANSLVRVGLVTQFLDPQA